MRILAAHPGPAFSVADVFTGWTEAFAQLGCQVARYNLSDRLTFYDSALLEVGKSASGGTVQLRKALTSGQATERAVDGLCSQLYRLRPDVLFVVSAFFYPAGLLDLARSYGTRVVLLHTESPYEDQRQAAIAQHADVNLVNDPTNLSRFPTGTRYVPHAYRPHLHKPGLPVEKLACDLGFVGTGYPSRIDFLERMDLAGLDVLLAGNWQGVGNDSPLRPYLANADDECLDNAQAVDVYRSARVGLNLYRREAETDEQAAGWAMGPREVELAACGAFFLRDRRGEGDEVLSMLPTFTGPEEAGDSLRHWLGRDDRGDYAAKAREAIADRTFTNHAAALLRTLD